MRIRDCIIAAALLLASLSAAAASFSGGSGLTGNLALDTDFSDAVSALGADQAPGHFYSLVSFEQFLLGPNLTGGTGVRTRIAPLLTSAITFSVPGQGIALLSRDAVPTRITAYLVGVEVESFVTLAAGYANPTFYGLTGLVFDELRFTHDTTPATFDDRYFAIDRLQVTTVPLPAPAILILVGLIPLAIRARGAMRRVHPSAAATPH